MNSEKTLFQICQDATAQAINNCPGQIGFSIAQALGIVKQMTTPEAYPREQLFDFVAKCYVAICANEVGFRSLKKRQGVYVDEEIVNEGARLTMIENARLDASARQAKADNLQESYELRFKKDACPGQLGFDIDNTFYQEMSADELIEMIRKTTG